jgi:hypothetical protein
MPAAVRDIVAHVASHDTPASSIDAFVRSVADAVGGIASKADVATLQRDLVANVVPLTQAIAFHPGVTGSVAPVGVAPAAAVPPGAPRRLAPGMRRDDINDVPGSQFNAGPSPNDVPNVFAELKAELAALASKLEGLAGVVNNNMAMGPVGGDSQQDRSAHVPQETSASVLKAQEEQAQRDKAMQGGTANGPVDHGS